MIGEVSRTRSAAFRLTYTTMALLLMGGLAAACDDSPGRNLVDTNARVPDPCGLIQSSTAVSLTGVKQGVNAADLAHRTANTAYVGCKWQTPDDVKHPKKGGLIVVLVSVELKVPKGHSDLGHQPRIFVPSDVKCVPLPSASGSSSCWYENGEGIVVVVHKGHSDVSIRAFGTYSRGLEKPAYPTTAQRLADDAIRAL